MATKPKATTVLIRVDAEVYTALAKIRGDLVGPLNWTPTFADSVRELLRQTKRLTVPTRRRGVAKKGGAA